MVVVRIVVGTALLFLGRQLFWLFVGGAGFILGFSLAGQYLSDGSDLLVLIIGLVAGVIGAVLTVFLQRLAVAAAGFVVGGTILLQFSGLFNLPAERLDWLLFVIGGVIGALLVSILFDWGLIVLSTLAGANLIARATDLNRPLTLLVLAALVVFGIAVQAAMMQRTSETKARRSAAGSDQIG